VKGGYTSDGGEIVGEMNGNVLEGYWIENSSGERCATAKNGRHHWGRIRWTFDGGKFVGNWSYCDKPVAGGGGWTGERSGDVPRLRSSRRLFLQLLLRHGGGRRQIGRRHIQ
jgi:hypothetical protein